MPYLNRIDLMGHAGRSPEMKYLPSGTEVSNFSIAVTEKRKDREPVTQWFNIIAFGRLAQICAEYIEKGSLVFVTGRLQVRTWENKDGEKRTTVEIVAASVQLIGKGKPKGEGKPSNHEDEYDGPPPDDDVPF